MATTLSAPIRIGQVNSQYYVGESNFLGTIQQAVTFAVADGNSGVVVIAPDYTGTDTIAAVTGGSASVYIVDERNGQRQVYLWYSNAYVAEPILPVGIGTSQINHWLFVGAISKYNTIQSAVTYAATLASGHFAIIIQPNYNAGENIASITGGNSTIYLSDQRTDEWQNYRWNGTQFVPSDFIIGGDLNVAGDIYGANLQLVGNIQANAGTFTGDLTSGGDLNVAGDTMIVGDLTASDATFAECIVDDSPVRTFANTPDGPGEGMVWPPIGEFAISGGDHWQNFLSAEPEDFNGGQGTYMGYSSGVTNFYNQGTPMGAYNFWAVDSSGNRTRLFALNTQFNTPAYTLFNPNAAANSQQWTTYMGGDGSWMFAPAADNGVSQGACMSFTRNGTTVTGWSVSATSSNINGSTVSINAPQGTTLNGPVTATGTVLVNNGTSATSVPLQVIQPNVGAGLDTYIFVGQATTNGNAAKFGMQFQGSGSTSNLGLIGIGGSGNVTTFDYYSNWNIPGTLSTHAQLNVISNNDTADGLPPLVATSNGLSIGWNAVQGSGATNFVNSRAGGSGGFSWYNVAPGTTITSTLTPSMTLDGANNLIVQGSIAGNGAGSYIQAGNPAISATAGVATTRLVAAVSGQTGVAFGGQFNFATSSGTTPSSSAGDRLAIFHHSMGPDGDSPTLLGISRNGTILMAGGALRTGTRTGDTWSSGTPSITSDGNVLVMDAAVNNRIYFNWDQGSGVNFGNGNAVVVASIDPNGAFAATKVTLNNSITIGQQIGSSFGSLAEFRTDNSIPRTYLDSWGEFHINERTPAVTQVYGPAIINGPLVASSNVQGPGIISPLILRLGWSGTTGFIDALGPNPTTQADIFIRTMTSDQSTYVNLAHFTSGGLAVNGTFTAVTKNFRIPHPLDDTKELTHSCIEGPEIAVFYRGEGETVNGVATITLPDYFEALTRKEGRTIQLTEMFGDADELEFGNFLAAGRVKDGKFNVRSNNGKVKFYWEVKAVRKDVEPLRVVTNKADRPDPPKPDAPKEPEPAKETPKKTRKD